MTRGGAAGGGTVSLPLGPHGPLTPLVTARRSVKAYDVEPLDIEHLAAALWGATASGEGVRAHASARGRDLVTVTVVAGDVRGLPAGAYRYSSRRHELAAGVPGDHRPALAAATLDAAWLVRCPVVVMLCADHAAANESFQELGSRHGERFAWVEAGLIAQNLYLWAAGAELGTVFVGGLDEPAISRVARDLVANGEEVLGLMPVGRPLDEPARSAPPA